MSSVATIPITHVESRILTLRGQKVILDSGLAALYGVPTKALNQAVRRNQQRFPAEFVFRLTEAEVVSLRSQTAPVDSVDRPSSRALAPIEGAALQIGLPPGQGEPDTNRSQIVTGSQKHRDPRFLPYAFTEHGALMAANVLRSRRAIRMSVAIVQTFVRLRRLALSFDQLTQRVEALERVTQESQTEIRAIVAALRQLMTPPQTPRREIGFHVRDEAPARPTQVASPSGARQCRGGRDSSE